MSESDPFLDLQNLAWNNPAAALADPMLPLYLLAHPDKGRDLILDARASLLERSIRDAFGRLSEVAQRLFAVACAERVLHLFERKIPGDNRPRLAIQAARRAACGTITQGEQYQAMKAADDAVPYANRNPEDSDLMAAAHAAYVAVYAASWNLTRAWEEAGGAAFFGAGRDFAAKLAERQWQAEWLGVAP